MSDYQRQLELEVERSRIKQGGIIFHGDRTDLFPSYASLHNCVESEEIAREEAVEDYRSINGSARNQNDISPTGVRLPVEQNEFIGKRKDKFKARRKNSTTSLSVSSIDLEVFF